MEKVSDIAKMLVKKPRSNPTPAGQLSFDGFMRQELEKAVARGPSKKSRKPIIVSDPAPLYTLQPYESVDLAFIFSWRDQFRPGNEHSPRP